MQARDTNLISKGTNPHQGTLLKVSNKTYDTNNNGLNSSNLMSLKYYLIRTHKCGKSIMAFKSIHINSKETYV